MTTHEIIDINGRRCHIINGGMVPSCIIVKPLGEFEWKCLEKECDLIASLTSVPFTMIAFEVTEKDLRKEGAEETFRYLTESLTPYIYNTYARMPLILGGYSLGGLFALWSATKTDIFDAVMAGSPSLWVDGWEEYVIANPPQTKYLYMSLGDKEECTKKHPYCIIGDRVRRQHERNLQQFGEDCCTLVWNKGGHFADIEQRKANGFAWCIEKLTSTYSPDIPQGRQAGWPQGGTA